MENIGISAALISQVAIVAWLGGKICYDIGVNDGLQQGHCAHVKEWSVTEGNKTVTYKCEGK